MNLKKILYCLLALPFFFSSCGEEDRDYDQEIRDFIARKNWTIAERTPDGLFVVIDVPGSLEKPTASSTVTVDYRGYLLNESVFDSSFGKTPLTIGLNQVIRGWTIGIPKFGRGGKGKILMPPSLGYGDRGQNGIPANSVLIFDVELIDFR